MAKWNKGAKNPMWRGGRIVASNGYVLVHVGKEHHRADVRGYAYEHRLVAEQVLGRRLRKGEIAHHKNGIRTDNRRENIELVSSIAEHLYRHRSVSGRRAPGEPNPAVRCVCGCGEEFLKYDSGGRPRSFKSGHNNSRPATTEEAITTVLQKRGPRHRSEIASHTDISVTAVATCLSKLKRERLVDNDGRGVWGLLGTVARRPNNMISCACGCGAKFRERDAHGRVRRFVSGHNARKPSHVKNRMDR
jgi:hypothetical protein